MIDDKEVRELILSIVREKKEILQRDLTNEIKKIRKITDSKISITLSELEREGIIKRERLLVETKDKRRGDSRRWVNKIILLEVKKEEKEKEEKEEKEKEGEEIKEESRSEESEEKEGEREEKIEKAIEKPELKLEAELDRILEKISEVTGKSKNEILKTALMEWCVRNGFSFGKIRSLYGVPVVDPSMIKLAGRRVVGGEEVEIYKIEGFDGLFYDPKLYFLNGEGFNSVKKACKMAKIRWDSTNLKCVVVEIAEGKFIVLCQIPDVLVCKV